MGWQYRVGWHVPRFSLCFHAVLRFMLGTVMLLVHSKQRPTTFFPFDEYGRLTKLINRNVFTVHNSANYEGYHV
jgi:hypothetical protein